MHRDKPTSLIFATVFLCLLGHALTRTAHASTTDTLIQLENQVAAAPTAIPAQQIKQAVLKIALERARNAHDVGLHDEAQALVKDVRAALAKPAQAFARRNPEAAHLGILRPLLTEQNNPYLKAMVQAAHQELAEPDDAWPRATAGQATFNNLNGAHGVRSAAIKMREYFWLFAHEQSPMRGDPELLKRALRRAHAYIDGLTLAGTDSPNAPALNDQFAVEESLSGLYEIIELHPNLLLPSQQAAWDHAFKKTADTLWPQMRKARAWNLNIETARMVGVLNLGYYLDDQKIIDKVIAHVDTVLARMRPDGAWPYHGEGNPSVNYHNVLLRSLLRIYEQTGHEPIAQALAASQWKGPVMGRTDEFWTSPFNKTYRWNFEKNAEAGLEAVAALSGNPYVRWMLDREIKADRDQVAWYRADIKPKPLPDQYTLPDRNVNGPRAWYGRFMYAATLHQPPPKMEGHETLMGTMTVDAEDGRLNSILTDVTPRIWMFPEDQMAPDGRRANSAWGVLTKDLNSATTITRNYSVSTALHGITAVRLHAYQGAASGWQGRQIWIGLPDRVIGLVSVTPGEDGAEAYAVNGVLRLISGGTAGAKTTKELEQIKDGHYRYGELDILVHDTTYSSLTPVTKTYRRDHYPATELTFSNRPQEPGPPGERTRFEADQDFRFLIEVRPTWTTDSMKVQMLGDQQLLGIQATHDQWGLQVWLNASAQERACNPDRKQLPRGKASFTLSDGVLGRPPFSRKIPSQVNLEPGQHAVLVVSPDPHDHQPGWNSFQDMVRTLPAAHR